MYCRSASRCSYLICRGQLHKTTNESDVVCVWWYGHPHYPFKNHFKHSLFLVFHSVEQAKLNSASYISASLSFILNKHSLLNNVSGSLRFLCSANLRPVGVLWLSCVDAIAVQKLSITSVKGSLAGIVHKPPKYDYYTSANQCCNVGFTPNLLPHCNEYIHLTKWPF